MTATQSARSVNPEVVEARCRRLMALASQCEVRGWAGQRVRDARLAECDEALDEWNDLNRRE